MSSYIELTRCPNPAADDCCCFCLTSPAGSNSIGNLVCGCGYAEADAEADDGAATTTPGEDVAVEDDDATTSTDLDLSGAEAADAGRSWDAGG